jgi:hypothetical protein
LIFIVFKSKFSIDANVTLVLERDGSVVDAEFEIIQLLAASKETIMILTEGQQWSSTAPNAQVGCFLAIIILPSD